jgi:bifunctional non-homologous end joining protein LigD
VPHDRKLSPGAERGLEGYRARRNAGRTPEPFGARAARPGLFVVQQHAARRLHYDFRLEWDGVLLSWAVPRGPSLDPAEKRLAVQVEDHPLDYADFEGVIPEGNYGAGAVLLWDRGRWTPLEDPDAGLEAGKLLFDLEGYKLRGRFTLVRTGGRSKPDGREWLLIKKPDGHARSGAEAALSGTSVLSGLTLEELRDGSERSRAVEREIAASGAPARRVDVRRVEPMLAEPIDAPFSDPDWLFEVKYDGYRMLASAGGGEALLRTRNGHLTTERFPEVARALVALPVEHVVLDGEIVAMDLEGRPCFQRLQQRARLSRRPDIERASVENPVTFFAFDLLGVGDRDLRGLPLVQRKAWLERLLPTRGPLRYAEHFAERGEQVLAAIEAQGLEGMVAKRADSPYRAGRSPAWRKLRLLETDLLVVVGFTPPGASRPGFGALDLGWYVGGELVYAGRVGTGFSDAQLAEIRALLDEIVRDDPPCSGALPRRAGQTWVEPALVCEVRYAEVTGDGRLRQPRFVGLRHDRAPAECLRPDRSRDPEAEGTDLAPDLAPAPGEGGRGRHAPRQVPFTNLTKVFWPAEGITKGDLVDYYRRVSEWLLPYLADRPLVLTRYPDGIEGKSFFQKDAPDWVPDWVRREVVWSEHAQREVAYFVCDDVESLLYVVNMGTIPLHVWSSRVADLAHPDWCILDLDPKGAPFDHVLRVARAIRELCEELELPSFPKTSGSSGLHVLIPLGATLTHEQSRTFGELLAREVVRVLPEIASVARAVRAREGKVYVDYLQNRHGQLLVAPFSVRPLPAAPVSMPLRWREVNARLSNGRYTIANAVARMKRLGEDPFAGVLDQAADLRRALARLSERLGT